jgi:hypothetical protein
LTRPASLEMYRKREGARRLHEHGVFARFRYNDLKEAARDLRRTRALCSSAPFKGQYSIRINDQWRVCFEWADRSPGPSNVEIVDYH